MQSFVRQMKKSITVRIEEEQLGELERLSKKEDTNRTVLITKAIKQLIHNHGTPELSGILDRLEELERKYALLTGQHEEGIDLNRLDNDTHIKIEQYAKDCGIEMSEAYSDILRIGLEILSQNKLK